MHQSSPVRHCKKARARSVRSVHTTTQTAVEEEARAHGGDRVAAALASCVKHTVRRRGEVSDNSTNTPRAWQTWRPHRQGQRTSKRLRKTHAPA